MHDVARTNGKNYYRDKIGNAGNATTHGGQDNGR
jgi:hypothetical protein